MNYFIDTNVAIAYSFFPDKHHNSSINFFSEINGDVIWSSNVFDEYNDTFHKILMVIELFLDKVYFELMYSNEVFLNKNSFENFVLKKTVGCDLSTEKKLKLIDIFWEEFLLGIFQEKNEFDKLF